MVLAGAWIVTVLVTAGTVTVAVDPGTLTVTMAVGVAVFEAADAEVVAEVAVVLGLPAVAAPRPSAISAVALYPMRCFLFMVVSCFCTGRSALPL